MNGVHLTHNERPYQLPHLGMNDGWNQMAVTNKNTFNQLINLCLSIAKKTTLLFNCEQVYQSLLKYRLIMTRGERESSRGPQREGVSYEEPVSSLSPSPLNVSHPLALGLRLCPRPTLPVLEPRAAVLTMPDGICHKANVNPLGHAQSTTAR